MKKIISIVLVVWAINSNVYSQDSFSNEYSFPLSIAVNANLGAFSTGTEDFQINNRPMLSGTAFFTINPNLFLGGGIGVSTWNYNLEGEGKFDNKYYNVPIYAVGRYFFGEEKKSGIFFDAKIGYRFGNKITVDMLSQYRTGEDFRFISGHGLYSSILMGISYRRIELSFGMDIQGLNYDVVDHSVVIATRHRRDREESISTTVRAFIFQLGYWF